MKKIIYTSGLLLALSTMQSCEKFMDHAPKQINIDAALASGAEYTLNLQQYGDADDVASITKQGTAFTTSEITNTTGTFSPVYHYTSFTKTGVTDQVVLTVTEKQGCSRHGGQTMITINFTVQ